jgi:hypothetical protein
MSDGENDNGSDLRDLRWWWLSSATRPRSSAEMKALPLLFGFFFVFGVTLCVLLDKLELFVLHARVFWIDLVGGLGLAMLAAYLATGTCRFLWPQMLKEAETNFSKTAGESRRKRRERNSRL